MAKKFKPQTREKIETINNTSSNLGAGSQIKQVLIKELSTNKYNERFSKRDTEDEIKYLTTSIEEQGLITPISVAKNSDGTGFNIISGHRRVEAAKRLGMKNIAANIIVVKATTEEGKELKEEVAVIESNLTARKYNNETELAEDLLRVKDLRKELVKLGEIKEDENTINYLAQMYNISKSKAEQIARLDKLEPSIKEMVLNGEIPVGVGTEIARLDGKKQEEFYKENKDELGNQTKSKTKELIDEKKGLTKNNTKIKTEEELENEIEDNIEGEKEKRPTIADAIEKDLEAENTLGVSLKKHITEKIQLSEIEESLIKQLDFKLDNADKKTLLEIIEKYRTNNNIMKI